MKKPNVLIEMLKLMGALVLGWFLWVLIFAFLPGDSVEASEPFPGAVVVFGVLTGLIVVLGIKYNGMQRAYQNTKAAFSNINIYEEKAERLLDKANRVADKYMVYEECVQTGIAKERSNKKTSIRSAHQFQTALENYPDLKANSSIMELLRQIRECENALMHQKVAYNMSVEEYNALIHSFPTTILRVIFRFKDAEFYTKTDDADMISDEELGI